MSDYQKRKQNRKEHYERFIQPKSITCTACSGSGYYDHNGSPKCGSCNGTGKMKP